MTHPPVELPVWTRQRWCLMIFFILATQVALIFLLEKHATGGRPKILAVPQVRLRENISLDAFAVTDPTVFVLPHHHGFSGGAWLNHLPSLNFQPADWTEAPRALPFSIAALDNNIEKFVIANAAPQFETLAGAEPPRTVPVLYPMEAGRSSSTLHLGGALAQRRLLVTPLLVGWPSADLVTNSVVQVLVDAPGRTISAVLLAPGIRLAQQVQADAQALELAKAAQFEPAAPGTITVGTMIFEWQTLPPPATNAPVNIQ